MFDKYIVCEENFRAPPTTAAPGGVVEVRMPYYRGLGLSMVEAVDLTSTARPCPPTRTTFTVHGNTYPFDHCPGPSDDRWEMGERASSPSRPTSPWRPGSTTSAVAVRLRISYMPVPGGGRDTKTFTLA